MTTKEQRDEILDLAFEIERDAKALSEKQITFLTKLDAAPELKSVLHNVFHLVCDAEEDKARRSSIGGLRAALIELSGKRAKDKSENEEQTRS